MKRKQTRWIGLLICSIVLLCGPSVNGQGRRSVEPGLLDIKMPEPTVRRRVPRKVTRKTSRVTSMQADRARQALQHSRPQPTRSYVPKHVRMANAETPIEPIADNMVQQSPSYANEGTLVDSPTYDSYAGESVGEPVFEGSWEDDGVWESCDSCGGDCGNGCGCGGDPSSYPFGYLWGMGNLDIFAGVQGFVGPYNQGDSGSFGFQEGFNFGTVFPLLPYSGIGWQIGTRSTQSNLSGADFSNQERHQTFFTTGLFKRACCGLQAGIVLDILEDNWFAEANTSQIRGEFSYRYPSVHEWGYRFSASTGDDEVPSPIVNGQFDTFEGTNLHSLFYRRRLSWTPGGVMSFFAGFSGDDDGYVGADAQLPLSDFLSLRSSFSYLVPEQATNAGGTENEAWNVSVMFVFNLRGVRPGFQQSMFTPLLDVADNGNFILDRTSIR